MRIILGILSAVIVWKLFKLTIGALIFLLIVGALVGSLSFLRRRAK
jgi:hypothetical protein